MIPFTRFAFFTVARDTAFVALAAATLMVGFSFEPALACKIGATVALVYSVGLVTRASFLTDERLKRSEAWRALRPDERPEGEDGLSRARTQLETLLLRFAKAASGVAGLLFGTALLLALAAGPAQDEPSPHHFVSAGHSEITLR
jgi:hypothetical protein